MTTVRLSRRPVPAGRPLAAAVTGILALVGLAGPKVAPGAADTAAAVPAVFVTPLPQGEREIIGAMAAGAHVLRLSARGELVSWTDPAGDVPLLPPNVDLPALEVCDAADRNRRLLPADRAAIAVRAVAGAETRATVAAGGVRLTYVVEPGRLGVRVEGPSAAYLVRGRCPCRAEGCRVVTPGATLFASADQGGGHAGAPQLLVDGRRALALAVSAPEKSDVTWRLTPTGPWAVPVEHVSWEVELKKGATVWLAAAAAPRHAGPVRLGLYRRRLFRPDGPPAAVATLSGDRLAPGRPVTLRLSAPPDTIVPGGMLVAALLPTAPEDPVEADEHGRWYTRYDHHESRFLSVRLRPVRQGWELGPPAGLAPGVYRLRLWVVPKETRLPETLGGSRGVHVGYFPGFEGRGTDIRQPHPQGDVLVTAGAARAGSLTVRHPAARQGFWRGEPVHLLVQARGPGHKVSGRLTVRRAGAGAVLASRDVAVALHDGFGVAELAVETGPLAPGRYEVVAEAPDLAAHGYHFTIAPPAGSGMPVIQSPLQGPFALDAFARVGVTAWTDVMPSTGGFTPPWPAPSTAGRQRARSDPALPLAPPAPPGGYDDVAARGWVYLQGVQSRQISFSLHHSIPEHVEETLRKHLVYAQLGRRFPGTLGLVFDYDLAGTFGGDDGVNGPFARAGRRRAALLEARWQAAWAEARRRGAAEADRPRLEALFRAGVIGEIYRRSVGHLHAAVPGQRHTTAATADHAPVEQGQYLPSIYGPLDFRYLETWNDQVYPNGAHDMQGSFWTALLRMERKAGQPVWVTAPAAPQPGAHFRRVLDAAARGATGTGYNAEGAAGLTGGWGALPLACNVRAAQEGLTGELARQYGTWLNRFEPAEEVALLYSVSQGGSNFGLQSPVFFAYYTLAQINRPARLVTEDEVAAGALKAVKALVIVRQKAKLPAATRRAIEAFAAGGGTVVRDRDSDLTLPGTRLADVGWPDSLWPNGGNAYHRLIRAFPATMGGRLRRALGNAGRPPLECPDGTALVACKRAGPATLVVVTNNSHYPFEALFTAEQRTTFFYRWCLTGGTVFAKDVRVPRAVTLTLRDDLARKPPRIYDVFAGAELKPRRDQGRTTVTLDLATLQGRVLLLTRDPVSAPALAVGARADGDPLATLVTRSAVPLPVRVRVGSQEVYRAATPAGSCDTFALGPDAGPVAVEVTELVTGQSRRGVLTLSRPAAPALRELPAVQVWEPDRLRKLLAEKGLAIYVDPRQAVHLAAARRLAGRLGNGAEVVFNPPVHDYVVSWDPTPAQERANEPIRRDGRLGWRRMVDSFGQWTGALRPAPVWNRPVLLFGSAVDNRLLAELNQVTLAARPALPELVGPGRAVVHPLAAPFWNGRDAAVVLCADAAGLERAFDRLAALAGGKAGETFTATDDGGARQERRRLLGFEPPAYPAALRPVPLADAGRGAVGLAPLLPVSGLAAVRGGVLAAVHSPGRNLVRLDDEGRAVWRVVTAGYYQPTAVRANAAGESVVADETFVWRHASDGRLRWKMLGEPVGPPAADGSVWVRTEAGLARVSAAGAILTRREPKDRLVALSADGRTLFVQRPGDRFRGREKSDTALVAIRDGREAWVVPRLPAAEVRLSDDGRVLACLEHEYLAGRDDLDVPDSSRLTALDAATGRVLLRRPAGESLTALHVAPDGKHLAALGHHSYHMIHLDPLSAWTFRPPLANRFSDRLYLADVSAGVTRRVRLPQRGVWALAFAADGRACWIAGERLHRLDVATLALTAGAPRRFLCLAARPGGGLYGGTADGRVVWLDEAGQVRREAEVASGIAAPDLADRLRSLRDAPLADSPALRPHEVPAVIKLAGEATRHQVRGDLAAPRGDGIQPLQVAVRIPARGRYRFTLVLANPQGQADKMGVFRINPGAGRGPRTAPVGGDRWTQAAELELGAGTVLFTLMPEDWKDHPLLKTLSVRRAGGRSPEP